MVKTLRDVTWLNFPTWPIAGTCLLSACLGWTFLSTRFQYGRGHDERPIIGFLSLYLIAWVAFAAAAWLLTKSKGKGPLWWIVAVALVARLFLVPSSLIQENDVYRYVLDGQVVRHGENPYRYAPLVVSDLAEEPLKGELSTPPARLVLSRVGYPEIPTIYPPAAQFFFAVGAWIGGWDWMGQRWTFLALDLAVLGLLFHLLPQFQIRRSWVLLYAWNPLVLKEVINSVHLDVLVAVFLLALLFFLGRYERASGSLWIAGAGFSLGMAVLSKLYPLVLAPACVLFLTRRTKGKASAGIFLASLTGTVVVGFLPFLSVGLTQITSGLTTYAREWVMNAGAFALLSSFLEQPRLAAALAVGSFAVLIPWFRGSRRVAALVEDFQWLLLLWFLLLPAPFPWYALPLVSLLALGLPASGPSLATIVLSGSVGLYYLSFFYEYQGYAPHWWATTRGVEHTVVWVAVVLVLAHQIFRNTHVYGFDWIRNSRLHLLKGGAKS